MDSTVASPIAMWVGENFFWVMVAILVLNMTQRKHQQRASKKRFATLYLALATFLIFTAGLLVTQYGGSDPLFFAIAAVIIAATAYFHRYTFPFRMRSRVDGRRLTWDEILYDDEDGDGPDRSE